MLQYIVSNLNGFNEFKYGDIITFESADDVNSAISLGALLTLPHATVEIMRDENGFIIIEGRVVS